MIYALLSKKCHESHYALVWAESLRLPGFGNLGNACILGTFGPAAHPLCCDATHFLSERSSLAWCGKRYIFLNRRDFYHLKTVYNPAIYCLCRWLIYLGDLVKADLPSGDFEAGAHAKKKSCWSDTAAWQRGRESRLQIKCSCKCWRWQDHRIQSSPPAPLLLVSCPTRWSLYCSLALCIDHLVGGGNPIWAAVKYSDHCWGLDWSIWTNFFAKCKFYICSCGAKKFWCIFKVFLPPKLVVF